MTTKEIRVGDVVHVRGEVVEVMAGGAIRIRDRLGPSNYDLRDIVHVEPRPLRAGDKVRPGPGHPSRGIAGEIIAIAGEYAWVESELYPAPNTCRLADLERAQ
jgi:hypothetical protein